ncbi:hypothetical protein [Amycolatopsis sp. NPDC051372]|uniref:hypothetical protein n=1 Tax=Amycolatopsis sp. NPDC051372 TaxID=3155669 RepID=UPI00342C49EA
MSAELTIEPRGVRWTHLPLCVLDAVFSINARYSGVLRVCRAYADHDALVDPMLPAAAADTVLGTDREHPVEALADLGRQLGAERVAGEVLRNRGRTSPRGGILKAAAAIRYSEVLTNAGVQRIGDVAELLADSDRLAETELQLAKLPGHGAGARLSYLWMLAGDDNHVKPDRMVLRWLQRHLDRPVTVPEARELLAALADCLRRTAWEVDHAVWRRESGRT